MGNSISGWVIAGIIFFSIAIIIFIIRRRSLAVLLGISTAPAEGQVKKNKSKDRVVLLIGFISSILSIISFIVDPPFNKDKPQTVITNNNIITDNHSITNNNLSSAHTAQVHLATGTKPSTANTAVNTAPQKPAITTFSGIHIVSGQNQPEDAVTQQVTDVIQEKTGAGNNTRMPIVQGQFTMSPPKPEDIINGQQTVSYKISMRLQFYKPDGITACNLRVFETTITAYNDSPVDNIKQQALTKFCHELNSQLDNLLAACR